MSKQVRKLYRYFQPTSYMLELDPDRDSLQLQGTATIEGRKIGRPSQRITFHQKGLKVKSASITKRDKHGEQQIAVTRINHQRTLDEVRLHTETLLYAGTYSVTLQFEGKVQDSMHGIYACNYEVEGKKMRVISTQFESHYAREAFPCVDEPEAKATFDLTLHSPATEVAISNMPSASQSEKNDKKLTTFATTPKMAPYLLAFAFGDLQSRTGTSKQGIEVAIWATKAHKPAALDFALDVAKRGIDFFNDYYGVPYPLAKCDHVAVPDFAAGAMENWGFITYRETCLLMDPASASQSSRETIALVENHELSHQWFGDLVTMRWWDNLWLNESFANVMEYVATDALFPDWGIWNDFVAQEGLSSIRRDCIAGVQAVQTEVNHPDEISSIFDPSIVYAKGGRLLKMLMNYLSEGEFRKGLKRYFETHAYGNTTGDDLWQALSESSGKNVAGFMNPWLSRSGFPLVEVTQHGKELSLTQRHFLLDTSKADTERVWPVPLLSNNHELPELFEAATFSSTLSSEEFVRINSGAFGHYIVCYTEPEHAAKMAELAKAKVLDAAERLMLLHDSSLIARSGQQSFADTLRLLNYYDDEACEPVWDVIALIIAESRRFIDTAPELEDKVKAFVRNLLERQYVRLGWEEKSGEPSTDTKLRATIIGLGVYSEHQKIIKEALRRFEAYKRNPESVPSELRSVVMGSAVRNQVEGAFNFLLELDAKTSDAQLRDDIMGALTVSRSSEEAAILLDRLKDSGKVRAQDATHWIALLLRNRHTRSSSWRWFRDNWDWIEKTFSHEQSYDYYPRYAASAFNTPELLAEYKAFFEPKRKQPALVRSIAMGIEEIENRVVWIQRDLEPVRAFFHS
jgi:aminopeptidase N